MMVDVTIRLYILESRAPLAGVRVAVGHDQGDRLFTPVADGTTNSRGVARLMLEVPDRGRTTVVAGAVPAPDRGGRPGLRVAVRDSTGGTVQVTRHPASTVGNGLRLAVPVSAALAFQHRLIARKVRPSRAQKEATLVAGWRARQAKDPGPETDIGLCVARMLLETIDRSASPGTDLQHRAAEALSRALPADQLLPVRAAARDARKLLDQIDLPPGMPCQQGSDPKDMAAMLMSPGGPLGALTQALTESAPPPDTDLGPAQKGLPFTYGFDEWVKACITLHQDGELEHLAADQMQQYYPDGLQLVAPPSVNLVDVYDVSQSNYVRHARPRDRTLQIRQLDPVEGWLSVTRDMGLPLDHEDVLVLHADEDDGGVQVLATDVVAGQTVRLLGSGFTSEQATVRARFARWAGMDPGGRLLPDADFIPVFGWDGTQVDVHGNDTHEPGDTVENFHGDRIVFDWPSEAGEPGLYRIRIEFPNDAGLPTGASQDPGTCEISIESADLFSVTLWFAVLPPVDPQRVRVRALTVECVDETDPESMLFNLFDDVTYLTSAQVSRLEIDPADPAGLSLQNVLSEPPLVASHWFWNDGDTWNPAMTLLPQQGNAFRVLRLDEFINVSLMASEVEGEADRIIMASLMIALLVVLLLLLVVIAVAVVVILIGVGLVTAGTGTAILGIIGTIVTALFGTLLVGAIASIEAFFASLPAGGDPLGVILPIFSGNEIAHRLSPVLFHRVLWLQEPGPLPPSGIETSRTIEITNGAITERYRCDVDALGGIYRFTLVVDTP